MAETLPEAAPSKNHQTFTLVDAHTGVEDLKSEGGCGCGGHGHGGGGCGCGGHGHAHEAAGAPTEEKSGCGCGGHGHARAEEAEPEAKSGCGCGGHGHAHEAVEAPAQGGCGCGGHGHGHGHGHGGAAAASAVEELVVHSIPKVVRHPVLFAAMDALPVGENIVIVAPHQPDPLFAHLQESESHYRVETLEAGPADWRYRITRLA